MEPVTLTADGLTLRLPTAADLPDLTRAFGDPEVIRWTLSPIDWGNGVPPRFPAVIAEQWHEDKFYRWLIADEDDRPAGMLGFVVKRHGVLELVYWAAPWARGKGVIERACRAAITWAFETAGCPRIEWDAIIGNHASRLLALKLGFTMTGRLRASLDQRGTRANTWTAELLPGELRDTPPPGYDVMRARAVAFAGERPVLETSVPGLRLRAHAEKDVEGLMAACSDAEAVTWTTVPQPYERHHAEGFVAMAAGWWASGETAAWVLADAEDAFCGTIDLRLVNLRAGEVGFHTAHWARGKGYMTAALDAVCRYGFDVLGLERIVWKAYVGNEGSRRVAEKAGFTFEGTLRADVPHRGEFRDTWLAARLREDAR